MRVLCSFFLIEAKAKAKRGVVGNRRCLCFVKLFYCSIVELLHCYIARKTRFEAEAKAKATLDVEGNFGIQPVIWTV